MLGNVLNPANNPEGLSNARRHAQSETVQVSLTQTNGFVRVEIQDWGVGFDPTHVGAGSFGLEGLQERVRLFRGDTTVDSVPGAGTIITVLLPLPVSTDSGSIWHGRESG